MDRKYSALFAVLIIFLLIYNDKLDIKGLWTVDSSDHLLEEKTWQPHPWDAFILIGSIILLIIVYWNYKIAENKNFGGE